MKMTLPSPAEKDTYAGFNVILEGPTGTGKTYAIGTLVDAGLETFYLGLEPGLESLIGYFVDPPPFGKGLPTPPANLHWHYLQARTQDFEEMRKRADDIGKFDLSGLTKIRDINRAKNNQMLEVYTQLNGFIDQKDGKNYGNVDSWGTDRVIVIDGLSALSRIAMEMVTGNKPVRDKPDYGIAQNNLMGLIHKLTSGCNCHFVLLAHVNREVDEIMGGVKLFPNTIGKAIISDIQQPFSDVILSSREGDKFFWDTANSAADLKTRNLPIRSKIEPDFGQILAKWTARKNASQGIKPKAA
jgi:AAA domain